MPRACASAACAHTPRVATTTTTMPAVGKQTPPLTHLQTWCTLLRVPERPKPPRSTQQCPPYTTAPRIQPLQTHRQQATPNVPTHRCETGAGQADIIEKEGFFTSYVKGIHDENSFEHPYVDLTIRWVRSSLGPCMMANGHLLVTQLENVGTEDQLTTAQAKEILAQGPCTTLKSTRR